MSGLKEEILGKLVTTDKSSLVGAINEVKNQVSGAGQDPRIGNLASLTTSSKTSVVSAINEVKGNFNTVTQKADKNATDIAGLVSRETSNKTETTNAIKAARDEVTAHNNDTMPHKFVKGTKTYKYGFSINDASNGLVFNYEEV